MILSIGNTILTIVVITFVILFFSYLIGSYIYKRKHNIPVGECASCASNMKRAMKKAKKSMHKKCNCE